MTQMPPGVGSGLGLGWARSESCFSAYDGRGLAAALALCQPEGLSPGDHPSQCSSLAACICKLVLYNDKEYNIVKHEKH